MTLLESSEIMMGEKAHEFELTGFAGGDGVATYGLGDFADKKVLIVVFMCNHCPYVRAVWGRLVKLQEKFQDKGVQFIGINPNFHPDYPEETMEKMKKYYAGYNMNFPYLLDESQEVARVYGAVCTPDIFVYDDERQLRYHGRIDNSWDDEADVTEHELDRALEDLLMGKPVSDDQKPCVGCSIKWRE